MKKVILTLMFIALYSSMAYAGVISVDSFLSPDSVTIAHLETFRTTVVNAINSADGNLLQTGSVSSDKLDANANPVNFRNEAFNDWVYTGLIPPTSASLASTTTAGTAYISGLRVVKDATAHTYTASKWTYLKLDKDGTYSYDEKAIGSSATALPADTIRLARVSTDGTTVAAVLDQRTLSISLDSFQENFQRSGMNITVISPDSINITGGVIYNGTTRIKKASTTALKLGTAGDWATGGGARTNSMVGYVVVNPDGDIKLTTTAPTKSDRSGNTSGKLRYSVISSVYWRVLSWFYMNATGAGNVATWAYSDISDTTTNNSVTHNAPQLETGTTVMLLDTGIPQITEGDEFMTAEFVPTMVGSRLKVDVTWQGSNSGNVSQLVALFRDSVADALAFVAEIPGTATWVLNETFTHYLTADTTSVITFRVRSGGAGAGTTSFNGISGAIIGGNRSGSSITVTEI